MCWEPFETSARVRCCPQTRKTIPSMSVILFMLSRRLRPCSISSAVNISCSFSSSSLRVTAASLPPDARSASSRPTASVKFAGPISEDCSSAASFLDFLGFALPPMDLVLDFGGVDGAHASASAQAFRSFLGVEALAEQLRVGGVDGAGIETSSACIFPALILESRDRNADLACACAASALSKASFTELATAARPTTDPPFRTARCAPAKAGLGAVDDSNIRSARNFRSRSSGSWSLSNGCSVSARMPDTRCSTTPAQGLGTITVTFSAANADTRAGREVPEQATITHAPTAKFSSEKAMAGPESELCILRLIHRAS
mmetsp:Transcript_77536/g.136792  ORF Transcript_77536/g.136792 Transcript_77536/m.136792 type:complete len:317 (+) Transcript_77536:30-980(+)